MKKAERNRRRKKYLCIYYDFMRFGDSSTAYQGTEDKPFDSAEVHL